MIREPSYEVDEAPSRVSSFLLGLRLPAKQRLRETPAVVLILPPGLHCIEQVGERSLLRALVDRHVRPTDNLLTGELLEHLDLMPKIVTEIYSSALTCRVVSIHGVCAATR